MNGSGTIEKPRYARIAEEIRTQYALQKWQPPVPIETSGDQRDIGVLRTTQNDVTQRLRSITEHQVREYHERAEQLVRDSGTVRYNI